ncbi:putative UDP-N-acetyl-D-galactosamine:polypeptide N-acetylgalactosaminyltransferase T3 [Neospora caninum Liverpool]|uniref:Putative UDP-N-acetyl-D-galactosamine:polypeptide N-acetylgalactosaminyltransferase T3 n=1 Tax=Neospora caninum (strain Liverpool) TaxID=572307 RepID=F0VAC6_NEOCL|nr:putative UDP-N-acetyl-D-galactosamine:polypeptide N-acetylgalactosaminyltransferase T3 [Neospora caninum Liverpool]CBZ50615.1 putative UDP-N-acetyl-D-galactosamine:polypeptide N-acetylgalactosaminyltransferase T3 [Neospora caninum Liverpool]CEL65227.1 TPA: UDP-N-acetyl-D-galactosamine:polypeptide N-acetylgalactosaminyltransferase T3, putative [Neospora caninum Liverpool]|eukprot:XP_003880648.1 putative UDP-N-acetyl-D-galactosamine:polypeptide N-acetylgalactosaminyltransferase T3 [Neospora caninum Liverpool]
MKNVTPPAGPRPRTSPWWARYVWAALQILLLLAGVAWLSVNVAFLSEYYFKSSDSSSMPLKSLGDAARRTAHAPGDAQEGGASFEEASGAQHQGDIRTSEILEGAGPGRLHGRLGRKPDGQPGYTPGPPPPADLNMPRALARGGGFNLYLSDHLDLDRAAPDARHPSCRLLSYDLATLPKASVIIVFYNEPFSTLMRSVHSVLNGTPPQLLEELLLVDDGSTLPYIREDGNQQLVEYIGLLPAKVRLIRNGVRKGIVGARMKGIRESRAPIFVILDSHIEVSPQWLEPLLLRIQEDRRRVVMPQIDGIDAETFNHIGGGIGCKLGFLWKMMEHSYEGHQTARLPPAERYPSPTEFQTSPAMAGGLFAANKDFFFDVGAYDEDFQFWGTENLELSFRLWQCGGVLECAPCSRVYHIFRKGGSGYSSPGDSIAINKMRTMMWMDEYADLAWRVIGQPKVNYRPESLEKRREWRKRKGCKSFRWFMENVFPEGDVVTLDDVPYLGPLRNAKVEMCLDNMGWASPGHAVGLGRCHGGETQTFMFFRKVGHVMPVNDDEACLQPSGKLDWCRGTSQFWWDFTSSGQLMFRETKQCLSAFGRQLRMVDCDDTDAYQIWSWKAYKPPDTFTFPPVNRSIRSV